MAGNALSVLQLYVWSGGFALVLHFTFREKEKSRSGYFLARIFFLTQINESRLHSGFFLYDKTSAMKKILIINGHPNSDSFNFGLFEAYKKGALNTGAQVKEIVIKDLKFNPNLQFGYQHRTELEPDLIDAWKKLNGLTI